MNRIIKDAIFGAIGGVAATYVIGQVMGAISSIQPEKDKELEQRLMPEQPTEKLAERISKEGLGIELTQETKASLGQAIQWGYGIFWGGVYGVLRHMYPASARVFGLPFGVTFGLFGNAILLPATGLTPPAHKFPLSSQVRGVVSHYAYAATVEGVCRSLEGVERAVRGSLPRTKAELREVS